MLYYIRSSEYINFISFLCGGIYFLEFNNKLQNLYELGDTLIFKTKRFIEILQRNFLLISISLHLQLWPFSLTKKRLWCLSPIILTLHSSLSAIIFGHLPVNCCLPENEWRKGRTYNFISISVKNFNQETFWTMDQNEISFPILLCW